MPVACISCGDPDFKKAAAAYASQLSLCNDSKGVKAHDRYIRYLPATKRWAVYTNRKTHNALVGRFPHLLTAVFWARQRSW